jgi:DNA-binding XRE family transcriptional regulator
VTNVLNNKIEKLILGLGLTSTRFADYIEVNRPIISHILTGRNKPSLEIIQKIVAKFPELGYNWISDDEDLDMDVVEQLSHKEEFSYLFSGSHNARELDENNSTGNGKEKNNSQAEPNQGKAKTIQKILVFYSDNTFEQFNPTS